MCSEIKECIDRCKRYRKSKKILSRSVRSGRSAGSGRKRDYEAIWKKYLGKEVVPKNNSCELYFEEKEIEDFAEKLEKQYPEICYVNRLITHSWGQKVIRFYDLDGNLIEVGTPVCVL